MCPPASTSAPPTGKPAPPPQDRVSRHLTEAIRGTQSYHDPYNSGTSWELPNDYQHVWKTVNDEFIFTNNINFNPNEALHENKWQQMKALR